MFTEDINGPFLHLESEHFLFFYFAISSKMCGFYTEKKYLIISMMKRNWRNRVFVFKKLLLTYKTYYAEVTKRKSYFW